MQNRDRWHTTPNASPAARLTAAGAWSAPPPERLSKRTPGTNTSTASTALPATAPTGTTAGAARVRSPRTHSELPSSRMPSQTPATSPSNPAIEVRSPAARRRTALMGHPMKTAAPTAIRAPRRSRIGAEPRARGRNSLAAAAAAKLPRKKPRSSGRMYCMRGLAWSPSAPAAFSRKQEMQIPVFAGLPR